MSSELPKLEGRRRRTVPMRAFLEIAAAVKECRGDPKSFEEILKLANRLIDYRSACLFLVDAKTGKLSDYAKVGEQIDLISFVKFNRGEGFSAWVAKQRRPILVKGTGRARSLPAKDIKSFMSVPIFSKQELAGVVNMSHEEAGAFSEGDLELLQIVASQLTPAILRFYLENKLRERDAEIALLNQRVVELEDKLRETGGLARISHLLSEVEAGISQTLASLAGNTQFLRLALEGKDPKLLRRVKEVEKGISELEDLNYRLRRIHEPRPRKISLLRGGEGVHCKS